ncbi:hypothetical protein NE237_015023 [Protea cynaroides]|uniref:Uncharacterized protein n=1 Tax=Protea cynaroides TaxID=273540 RepID=A0A9Q0QQM5_9MAGN|nr:hypothetical protein NE237_015023 [Protea cynaroides]
MQPQTHHPLSCRSGCRHAAPPHPITKSTNPSAHLHPLFPPNSALLELTAVSRSSRTAWASGFSTRPTYPLPFSERRLSFLHQRSHWHFRRRTEPHCHRHQEEMEKKKYLVWLTPAVRHSENRLAEGKLKVDAVHHCSTLLSTLLHDE